MFSRLYVHFYLPFGQVIFSFILAYVWPYPPTPPPPPPFKVKRKRGNVYENLTLIVLCDVTLIYAKLLSNLIGYRDKQQN